MSMADTIVRLHRLACGLPPPDWDWDWVPKVTPPATSTSIAALEVIAGFRLPSDIQEFLEHADSLEGGAGFDHYEIGGVERLTRKMEQGDVPRTIEQMRVMPIIRAKLSEYLINDSGLMWRWEPRSKKVEKMASSFSAFLEHIGESWYAHAARIQSLLERAKSAPRNIPNTI